MNDFITDLFHVSIAKSTNNSDDGRWGDACKLVSPRVASNSQSGCCEHRKITGARSSGDQLRIAVSNRMVNCEGCTKEGRRGRGGIENTKSTEGVFTQRVGGGSLHSFPQAPAHDIVCQIITSIASEDAGEQNLLVIPVTSCP